jgi:hypothetical protein
MRKPAATGILPQPKLPTVQSGFCFSLVLLQHLEAVMPPDIDHYTTPKAKAQKKRLFEMKIQGQS